MATSTKEADVKLQVKYLLIESMWVLANVFSLSEAVITTFLYTTPHHMISA